MRAHLLTVVCKFGSGRAIFGIVVAIPAKKFIFGIVVAIPAKKFTDTRTNDRRRAIALAHSLNELKMVQLSS